MLDLDFAPIDVDESTTGYIGFVASVVASLTCFTISFWVERMKGSYKRLIIVLLILASCFFTWQTLIVNRVLPFSKLQLYISTVAGIKDKTLSYKYELSGAHTSPITTIHALALSYCVTYKVQQL